LIGSWQTEGESRHKAKRLYVSHGHQIEVIDMAAKKVVGTIPDTPGVHGIAVATDLGKGFISNGRANNLTIFDLKTLMATGKVETGKNPDAILYESGT
jgi:DNA-binding beta-propeller fold protein YncE